VALIFVHETSDALTSLVKKIDQSMGTAGKSPRPLGLYIIFVNNSDGLDKKLRELAEKESLTHVNFGIGAPPDQYEVSKNAEITAVIYSPGRRPEQHVTTNFALWKHELDEAKTKAIVKAVSEVLPK
jgi:hypothetical protein